MPFDFKAYDEKCRGMTPDELQREWQHYTRLITGASTSTAVSGLALPLTCGVSAIGVGMAAPAIHNARRKREIIERHLNLHGATHQTRKRDVLGSMAFSGTVGVVTLGVGTAGADAIAANGAEHVICAVAENETAIKVAMHAAMDGVGMGLEHLHTSHKKKKEAHKAFAAAGTFQAVEDAKAAEAGYKMLPYKPQTYTAGDSSAQQQPQYADQDWVQPPPSYSASIGVGNVYVADANAPVTYNQPQHQFQALQYGQQAVSTAQQQAAPPSGDTKKVQYQETQRTASSFSPSASGTQAQTSGPVGQVYDPNMSYPAPGVGHVVYPSQNERQQQQHPWSEATFHQHHQHQPRTLQTATPQQETPTPSHCPDQPENVYNMKAVSESLPAAAPVPPQQYQPPSLPQEHGTSSAAEPQRRAGASEPQVQWQPASSQHGKLNLPQLPHREPSERSATTSSGLVTNTGTRVYDQTGSGPAEMSRQGQPVQEKSQQAIQSGQELLLHVQPHNPPQQCVQTRPQQQYPLPAQPQYTGNSEHSSQTQAPYWRFTNHQDSQLQQTGGSASNAEAQPTYPGQQQQSESSPCAVPAELRMSACQKPSYAPATSYQPTPTPTPTHPYARPAAVGAPSYAPQPRSQQTSALISVPPPPPGPPPPPNYAGFQAQSSFVVPQQHQQIATPSPSTSSISMKPVSYQPTPSQTQPVCQPHQPPQQQQNLPYSSAQPQQPAYAQYSQPHLLQSHKSQKCTQAYAPVPAAQPYSPPTPQSTNPGHPSTSSNANVRGAYTYQQQWAGQAQPQAPYTPVAIPGVQYSQQSYYTQQR